MGGVLLNHSRGGQSLAVLVLTCALGLQVWAFSLGAQPLFRWAQQAGGEASDYGFDIVTDGIGNVYVGGGFYSTNALFDGTMVTNSGTAGAFLAKYDSTGGLVWVSRSTGNSEAQANGIALDSAGNIYASGPFRPEVTFGSNTLVSAGDFDIFLVKHDRFGNVAWGKRAGGAGSDFSFGIAVDAMTNVYLTGFFTDLATFDSTNLVSSGGQDIFVAKYSSGALDWVRQAGGATDSDLGYGIAVDAVGNAYVSGTFQGVASFGTNTLSGFGEEDIFVAKFDPSGNVLWARQAGGGALDQGYGIALDGENNCYVTGRFTDTAVFGAAALSSRGLLDIFVAKYDGMGGLLWVRQAGGTGSDGGREIAVDALGNCYVTGYFSGSAEFDGTMITSVGGRQAFIAKYSSSGQILWVAGSDGIGSKTPYDICSDRVGNVFITGSFLGAAIFGNNVLSSYGLDDIFVAALDAYPPALNMTRSGDSLVISWSADTLGFQLESTPTLSTSNNWSVVTNSPATRGGRNFLTNEPSGSGWFFRLHKP